MSLGTTRCEGWTQRMTSPPSPCHPRCDPSASSSATDPSSSTCGTSAQEPSSSSDESCAQNLPDISFWFVFFWLWKKKSFHFFSSCMRCAVWPNWSNFLGVVFKTQVCFADWNAAGTIVKMTLTCKSQSIWQSIFNIPQLHRASVVDTLHASAVRFLGLRSQRWFAQIVVLDIFAVKEGFLCVSLCQNWQVISLGGRRVGGCTKYEKPARIKFMQKQIPRSPDLLWRNFCLNNMQKISVELVSFICSFFARKYSNKNLDCPEHKPNTDAWHSCFVLQRMRTHSRSDEWIARRKTKRSFP